MRVSRVVVVVLLVCATTLPAAAQQQWTATGVTVPELASIDDAARDFMQEWEVPGSAMALSYQGRLMFARGYTWDDPVVEPVQPTSLFRIASMSKPITSVAIHMLIERGLLDYDTLLAATLGLQPPAGREADPQLDQVTVDHLLYHLGGWDRGITFDPMFFDQQIAEALGVDLPISKWDIATYMTGQELQHEPGTHYAYSNYGYMLLGMMVEQVTGSPFPEWVLENVFQPIGLGRPRRGHSVEEELSPGEVVYHGVGGSPYSFNLENMTSGGGWVLAAPDYLRFLEAVFDGQGRLLAPATVADMVALHPATVSASYGRGWTVGTNGGYANYGHGGSLPGLLAQSSWRADGLAWVGLINTREDVGEFDPELSGLPDHDLYASVGITDLPAGPGLTEAWIPAVAHIPGVGDSVWRSDVGLLSRSTLRSRIRLRAMTDAGPIDSELTVEPGEQVVIPDVLGDLGVDGSCPLRVFAWEPVTVTSRIYTDEGEGTFGQFLGGVTQTGGLRAGQIAAIPLLRQDLVARSNIGLLNSGRRDARFRVSLREASGAEVAVFNRTVPAGRVVQLNRPFAVRAGRSDIAAGYAVLTVLEGEELDAYGSVIDAGTNDPVSIPLRRDAGATRQWIAAAAHLDGAAGSVWRTDLVLLNRGEVSAQVEVVFRSEDGEHGLSLDLLAGEQRVLEDVVGEFVVEGSGSLEIRSDQPVLAGSRSYSVGPSGSFGQYLDGVAAVETLDEGDTGWLPQLAENDRSRTNIGLLNTSEEAVRVTVELYDGGGSLLASIQRRLAAGAGTQLNRPFVSFAGRSDLAAAYASVTVDSGSGLLCYASVIDNLSNDPTTIPMIR